MKIDSVKQIFSQGGELKCFSCQEKQLSLNRFVIQEGGYIVTICLCENCSNNQGIKKALTAEGISSA